jgi:hypothetical protein
MEKQPTALWLANELEKEGVYLSITRSEVAAELRRLHAVEQAYIKPRPKLTDEEIESIFLDFGWSWGERADMYVPVGRAIEDALDETSR